MKERFFRNRTAVFTVVFVLLVGLVGILAPVIAPNDPYETNILNKFASYSLQYPLGTDQLGRCVLSRMIYFQNASALSYTCSINLMNACA